VAHGRLGNLQPFRNPLHGLIPVVRHEPIPNVDNREE
jgi:hypothetical protein